MNSLGALVVRPPSLETFRFWGENILEDRGIVPVFAVCANIGREIRDKVSTDHDRVLSVYGLGLMGVSRTESARDRGSFKNSSTELPVLDRGVAV